MAKQSFDLAKLRLGIYQDRIFLGVPLQELLVAVEITAICHYPTFTINLDAGSDIAYHFDARSSEGRIVQNTCVAGAWGAGGEILSMPPEFVSSQPFTLKIAVEQELVVYLNGRVLTRYAHCLPLTQINTVHIVYPPENLQVQSVQVFEQTAPAIEQPPLPPQEITDMPAFLENLPPQFEPLRLFLEANLVPYIKFTATDAGHLNSASFRGPADWSGDPLELWQSKIGGHPYLPKGTSYPTDAETGEMMMFLMQINCADLPVIESLNLPRQGLLQFYIGLDVPMSTLSPEQHRVLYYPDVSKDKNDLITDFSFLAEPASSLEWYDDVYALNFSVQRDVFWNARRQLDESFEMPEALTELGEDFTEWISDYEDECTLRHGRINKLGGYPELHSYVDETIEGFRGRLLLELQHPFDIDNNFYFFIEDLDLANLNLSNVESYFVRV